MIDNCTQEERIQQISHAIYGNGKEGLITKMARIEEQMEDVQRLTKNIENIQTDIKVLLMFKAQESGKDEMRINYHSDRKWIITSIIATIGLVLTALGIIIL